MEGYYIPKSSEAQYALLHPIRHPAYKKGGNIRQTHGAAVWRPVVKLPEFRFPVSENARERLGAFRVEKHGKLNPEKHQEGLPPQRR